MECGEEMEAKADATRSNNSMRLGDEIRNGSRARAELDTLQRSDVQQELQRCSFVLSPEPCRQASWKFAVGVCGHDVREIGEH